MTDLAQFIAEEAYRFDGQVKAIEQLINDVVPIFQLGRDRSHGWGSSPDPKLPEPSPAKPAPAEPAPAEPTPADDFSRTTTALALCMFETLEGKFGRYPLDVPSPGPVLPRGKQVLRPTSAQVKACSAAREVLRDKIESNGIASRTFGENGPFTTTWVAELAFVSHLQDAGWDGVREKVRKAAAAQLSNIGPGKPKPGSPFSITATREQPEPLQPLEHSLPLLRAVRLAEFLAERDPTDADAAKSRRAELRALASTYFCDRLESQLAFSAIPDSRFDPAELTFCLEGHLVCSPTGGQPDESLIFRVLDVLREAQAGNAFWRPVKPMLASASGAVLFPVSVEVAASLLRICARLKPLAIHERVIVPVAGMLDRYYGWLRARLTTWTPGNDGKGYPGWHSEHVNENGLVHLWETAFVLSYLYWYRSFLDDYIADRGLSLSRVKVTTPDEDPNWAKLHAKKAKPERLKKVWKELGDPVTTLGDGYKVNREIWNEFIAPRLNSQAGPSLPYSMLLYGPPGTGKSTMAKNLAAALNYKLLTITVSDFLAGGAVEVEARAKELFEMLLHQQDCVILFDEIDHLLLDRESQYYHDVETVFQFMTPGMLTKLADLRGAERSIFVIATNFEERIDPAIKRSGRVDRRYLVLPLDRPGRRGHIKKKLENITVPDDKLKPLTQKSFLLSRSDINRTIEIWLQKRGGQEPAPTPQEFDELAQKLDDEPRLTSALSYQARLTEPKNSQMPRGQYPIDEYLAIVALYKVEERELPGFEATHKAVCDYLEKQSEDGNWEKMAQRLLRRMEMEPKVRKELINFVRSSAQAAPATSASDRAAWEELINFIRSSVQAAFAPPAGGGPAD